MISSRFSCLDSCVAWCWPMLDATLIATKLRDALQARDADDILLAHGIDDDDLVPAVVEFMEEHHWMPEPNGMDPEEVDGLKLLLVAGMILANG